MGSEMCIRDSIWISERHTFPLYYDDALARSGRHLPEESDHSPSFFVPGLIPDTPLHHFSYCVNSIMPPKKPEDLPQPDIKRFKHLEYTVVTLEKADLPSSSPRGVYYRYVVANTVSEVTGYRQGTKREVMSYCSTLIDDLNMRTIPKKKD